MNDDRLHTFAKRLCALLIFAFALCAAAFTAYAADTLFELKTTETICKGVTYEEARQITTAGLVNVHVLRVPLDDPYIKLNPVESQKEYGLKETVTSMLSQNGAIAGTNGDFFGMAGDYSASFGPVARDNSLLSLSTGFNREENDFAAFLLSDAGNPFITFLKSEIHFYNDGKENIEVYSINKVTDMVYPIIVTRAAMRDTAALDARFKGMMKVVVRGQEITYVSQKGETVDVPEDGYVLLIQEASVDYHAQFFKAGQRAVLQVKTSGVDFDRISAAIGGGGMILREGEIVAIGEASEGRAPRTALGITADKKQIILMQADGRSYSIGATNEEMGKLLLKYGAYNAMHLDGGGSSEMVITHAGKDGLNIVNEPSDGSERRVINALGVFNNAPVGSPSRLVIKPAVETAFLGVTFPVEIYALDEYYHKIDLDMNLLSITTDDPSGVWGTDRQSYTPGKDGDIQFTLTYPGLTASSAINAVRLEELTPSVKVIRTAEGERTKIGLKGTGRSGVQAAITNGAAFEITPPELGHMEGAVFVADSSGTGYIKCVIAGIPAYIAVYSGGREALAYDFERRKEMTFSNYPDGVTGAVAYSGDHFMDGGLSAKLSYAFKASGSTQAAYLNFTAPIEFTEPLSSLKMWVYGDGKGFWLRVGLTDADGAEYKADFAKTVDWTGWRQATAVLPENMKYPIKLERIYIASLETDVAAQSELYFDGLAAVRPFDENVVLPDAPKFVDALLDDLSQLPLFGFDITAVGKTVYKPARVTDEDGEERDGPIPENYDGIRADVLAAMTKNASRGLYMAETGFNPQPDGYTAYQWNKNYVMHKIQNVAILQMSAATGGSLLSTNTEQWAKFHKDILNMNPDHIIVELDVNPANFSQPKEWDLFHGALVRLRQAGKTVFVVSTQGTKTTATAKDGVRYINLGSLWTTDGERNEAFKILRFRVNGTEMRYELQ